ncbi:MULTISPECIES: TOBE-like domain-containing protein [Microbispora]
MRFLGPVTEIGGSLVRPHDIEISVDPIEGGTPATVSRVVRLGFEVRVEVEVGGQEAWVQVTREFADRLGLEPGDAVVVRPAPGARSLALSAV